MAADNRLELVIEVNASQGNAEIKGVNQSFSDLGVQAVNASKRASSGLDEFTGNLRNNRREVYEGTQAARLLGNEIGLRLPRSVSKFIAEAKMIGPLLSGAFEISVFVAMGVGIYELSKKFGLIPPQIKEWFRSQSDITKEIEETRKASVKLVEEWDKFFDRMDQLKSEGKLAGLEGVARTRQEAADLQAAVNKAKVEEADAMGRYNRLYIAAQKTQVVGGVRELTPEALEALKQFDAAQEAMDKAHQNYLVAKQQLENKNLELNRQITEEHKKQLEELQKLHEQINEAGTEQARTAADTWYAAQAGYEKVTGMVGRPKPQSLEEQVRGGEQKNIDWGKRLIADHQEAQKAVESLTESNVRLRLENARSSKDYSAAMAIELKELEDEKAKYQGNADAIAAIEERKSLIVQKYNIEIAESAKQQFDKTANTIEGFIDRVFLTAKSFSDIWRQLWTQAVGWVVKEISRMVAAWYLGQRQMATASAGGAPAVVAGGGSGIGGVLASVVPILARPAGTGGGGGAPGRPAGGGGFGGFGNLGALFKNGNWMKTAGGMAAIGGGTLMMGGLQRGSSAQTIAGGGMMGAGIGLAGGPIGAMGGAGIGFSLAGLQRGGWSGLGMTTAGGALIGAQIGTTILPGLGTLAGAAIGAAIGLGVGLVRLFVKGAQQKAREKVKAAYGVDISDKGILQQIVDTAKQEFGGNLDMAIRSSQVRDLIQLYGMTTGQSTKGMPKPMTPGILAQIGGSIIQQAQYSNGMATSGGALPGAALATAAHAFTVNVKSEITLSAPETKTFLETGVLKKVVENPRAIADASAKAAGANYKRRELAALQFQPATLLS